MRAMSSWISYDPPPRISVNMHGVFALCAGLQFLGYALGWIIPELNAGPFLEKKCFYLGGVRFLGL